jgi:NAD+ synthase
MDIDQRTARQARIIEALHVAPAFDPATEIERRVAFLCDYLERTRSRALVLGISGGIDSTVSGHLAQRAAQRARSRGHEAVFVAMRLPYGVQRDEDDAQRALAAIGADVSMTIDIKPASDAMLAVLKSGGLAFESATQEDFILGNIKARQRMIAQYAVAGTRRGLVIGTDQAAEALMGFFTKFGDGACDLTPLTGLSKRRVRQLGLALGTPRALVEKMPTADLESLAPLKPDELAFGLSYDEIDDFLEGKVVSERAYEIIFAQYAATEHKRQLPVTPP